MGTPVTVPINAYSLGSDSKGNPIVQPPAGSVKDPTVQYVSTFGNDGNDGKTWQTAKLTLAAAINALPVTGVGVSTQYGTVFLGPGTFVETNTPIPFNAYIHLIGTSSGDAFPMGTVLKLGNGRNTALLAYTAPFAAGNGYSHFLQVDHIIFDGNVSNNPSAPALVQIYNGGYQNTFRNVGFQNCASFALRHDNQAVNFSCYTCTFGGAQGNGGAYFLNDLAGGNVVSFFDTQIDNSGVDPILVTQGAGDSGGSNILTFINLKTEATIGTTNHQHVIRFTPRVGGGGNPFNISVHGFTAVNTISSGVYALFEDNEPGYAANWEIIGAQAGGYTALFHSAKTGQTSAAGIVKHLIAGSPYATGGAIYDYTPDIELSGGAGILTGFGSPAGTVTANVGAIYLRLDGGTSTTLYVKESGSGTTSGWVSK